MVLTVKKILFLFFIVPLSTLAFSAELGTGYHQISEIKSMEINDQIETHIKFKGGVENSCPTDNAWPTTFIIRNSDAKQQHVSFLLTAFTAQKLVHVSYSCDTGLHGNKYAFVHKVRLK